VSCWPTDTFSGVIDLTTGVLAAEAVVAGTSAASSSTEVETSARRVIAPLVGRRDA
jgi:hypothetical protein